MRVYLSNPGQSGAKYYRGYCLGRLLQVVGQRSVFMYGLANVHLYIQSLLGYTKL